MGRDNEIARHHRDIADLLDGVVPGGGTTGGSFDEDFGTAPGWLVEAIKRFFPREQWRAAVLIAHCESGFNPMAHNTEGEDSRGIFQINVGPGAHPELAGVNLFSGPTNVEYAAQIFRDAGSWRPWENCARMNGLL